MLHGYSMIFLELVYVMQFRTKRAGFVSVCVCGGSDSLGFSTRCTSAKLSKKGDFQTRTQKYTRLLARSLSLSHTGMCFVNLSSKSSHWDYVGQMPAGCAVFKYSHPAPKRFHSGDEQNRHLVGTVS